MNQFFFIFDILRKYLLSIGLICFIFTFISFIFIKRTKYSFKNFIIFYYCLAILIVQFICNEKIKFLFVVRKKRNEKCVLLEYDLYNKPIKNWTFSFRYFSLKRLQTSSVLLWHGGRYDFYISEPIFEKFFFWIFKKIC